MKALEWLLYFQLRPLGLVWWLPFGQYSFLKKLQAEKTFWFLEVHFL